MNFADEIMERMKPTPGMVKVFDNKDYKICRSETYNSCFRKEDGYFQRWGTTIEEDPQVAPSPEILDAELSTVCSFGCSHCYKSNSCQGENMSFETFKKVIDKFSPVLQQMAAGIGDIDANPDLWRIFEYCRKKDIVPNVTINGARMTPEHYDNLARLCGAVAVSHYTDDLCYNAVKELTDRCRQRRYIRRGLLENMQSSCTQSTDAEKRS